MFFSTLFSWKFVFLCVGPGCDASPTLCPAYPTLNLLLGGVGCVFDSFQYGGGGAARFVWGLLNRTVCEESRLSPLVGFRIQVVVGLLDLYMA